MSNKIVLDDYEFKLEDLPNEYKQLKIDKNYNSYEFAINGCYSEISKYNYEILNPSNDQTFKRLFTGDLKINGVTGIERSLSLLNSFLNYNISKLKYLFNEIPSLIGENREGLKVVDLPYLATLSDNSKIIINVEMQTTLPDNLSTRMLSYGHALRNLYNYPVIILLLINKKTINNNSFVIKPCKTFYNKDSQYIEDYVKVISLDLYYFLKLFEAKDDEENLSSYGLKNDAKSWIKLLTINNWSKEIKGVSPKRYPIPKLLMEPDEIISAIQILDNKNESQLIKAAFDEEQDENKRRKVFCLELWINAFKNKLEINDKIVPFHNIEHNLFVKTCNKFLNKNEYSLFVKMLKEKLLLEKCGFDNNLI